MSRAGKIVLAIVVLVIAGAAIALKLFLDRGISARAEPTAAETVLARRLRHWAVPRAERDAKNPVAANPEVLARARAHFADHCAICHANDGRGETEIGQNLYPKAPDMTLVETQNLSDGEIFYIIENGVRLTGMPAWGEEGPHDATQSWELVHFIRHLPKITTEELAKMESENPKSPMDQKEDEETRKFLEGGEPSAPASPHHEH
jgi:mono/diheme cytochrome c family protein